MKIFFLTIITISLIFPVQLKSRVADIHDLIRLLNRAPVEKFPSERMVYKKGVIVCTGSEKVAVENNKAVDFIKNGEFEKAVTVLEDGLKHAALFFPFRYNLGVSYLHLNKLNKSMLHFTKAQQVFPEYSKPYLQIGYIYQRWNMDTKAVSYFRKALKRNRNELNTFILIGDVYYKRNQHQMAKKYYEATLKIKPRYPNGLLGFAKIYFNEGKYIRAIVLFKSIDISEQYDKSYHYYYAETAFKQKDYKKASEQYTLLLKFKNDKFFLTNARTLIEYKLNLSRRFVER